MTSSKKDFVLSFNKKPIPSSRFCNTSTLTGFESTWFIPLIMALFTYSCSQWPVTADIIGWMKLLSWRIYLILSVVSYPSRNGMLQSIKIKSNLSWFRPTDFLVSTSFLMISIASRPSKQCSQTLVVWIPILYFRMIRRASMLKDWSSTIKILPKPLWLGWTIWLTFCRHPWEAY